MSQSDVYLVSHESPEVLAYAMAKYSRSAKSLRESIEEISAQKSAQFLNTFYFEYGHKSIADMAHIALAIENVSLLAAIAVVDEQRWDGQERSTRYQDFSARLYYTPPAFKQNGLVLDRYNQTIHSLFGAYETVSTKVLDHLKAENPHSNIAMPMEKWERTLKARTFDVARYLLPLSTMTSLGQITSGRTLEGQISRLRESPLEEMRTIGEWLLAAASDPNKGTPTLVKYAEASKSRTLAAEEIQEFIKASSLKGLDSCHAEEANYVRLAKKYPLDVELAASIVYPYINARYDDLLKWASGLDSFDIRFVLELGSRTRERYEELPRAYSAGHEFQFDILMDVGGYRDLHRHRKTVQLDQKLKPMNGFEVPNLMLESGCKWDVKNAIDDVERFSRTVNSDKDIWNRASNLQYALPLATRKRALFKMDLAQVVYMTELRTRSGGHFSYRDIAYRMSEEAIRANPSLWDLFSRVTKPEDGKLMER